MKFHSITRYWAFIAAVFAGIFPCALGQYWNVDPAFAPALESNTSLEGVVIMTAYPGGKILVNTSYGMINGKITDGKTQRLNGDGTVDSTFAPSTFLPLQSYANGRILVATSATDYAPYQIQRLLADGTIDPSFNGPSVVASGYSLRALPLADGRTLLYGDITIVGGSSQIGLVLLKTDGSVDGGFTSPLTNSAVVYYAAQAADGRILISGQFLNQGPTNLNYLARLNLTGGIDTTFNANGAGFTGNIYPQANGTALVGNSAGQLVRLTTTGTVDSAFVPNLVGSSSNWRFGPQRSDGRIFYTTIHYDSFNNLVRELRLMNPDGSDNTSFPALSSPTYSSYEVGFPILSDDGTYFEGALTAQRHAARYEISHILANGSIDPAYNPRFARLASVSAYARQADGKHLIAGSFDHINNVTMSPVAGLVRLNDNGTLDPNFSSVVPPGSVSDLAIQAGGKIIAFGGFPNGSGGTNGVIRINADGTNDDTFQPIAQPYRWAVDNAGYIYVINGSAQLRRYTPDGQPDATFQAAALNGTALLIAPMVDGSLLASVTSGNSGSSLVRLLHSGAIDPNFAPLPTQFGLPVALTGLPDGSAVLCERNFLGAYSYIFSVSRIQPTGTLDYIYLSKGTNGNFLNGAVALDIAGALFDLLRASSPGSGTQGTLDFGTNSLVLSCRTDGQLMICGRQEFLNPLQRFQRAALTSPSVDAQPTILEFRLNNRVLSLGDFYFSPNPITSGIGPFTYQWQKNGVLIPGQTSSGLFIYPVQASDAGDYSVVISNAFGSVTSPVDTLTVGVVPVITTQPVSQTIVAGNSVTFTAAASGTPAPTYRWQKNGFILGGATGSTYTIPHVAAGDAGNYTVVATNDAGSVTSVAVSLVVIVAPTNAIISIAVE